MDSILLSEWDNNSTDRTVLSPDSIRRMYPIRALLRCEKFKSFTLICTGELRMCYRMRSETTELTEQHLWDPLVSWLRDSLAAQMPRVKFIVEYAARTKRESIIGFIADKA